MISARNAKLAREHKRIGGFFLYSLARDGDKSPFSCKQVRRSLLFIAYFGGTWHPLYVKKFNINLFGQKKGIAESVH